MTDANLGRFGHHPDPLTDFCVEADCIEGLENEVRAGMADRAEVIRRAERALEFRCMSPEGIAAKNVIRRMHEHLTLAIVTEH